MPPPITPEYLPEFATRVGEILAGNETPDQKKVALKAAIGSASAGLESFRRRMELAHQIAQSPNPAIDDAKRQQFVAALGQAESEAMAGFMPGGVGETVDKLLYQTLPRSMPTGWKFGTALGGIAAAIGLPLLWEKIVKPATKATGHGIAAVAGGTVDGVAGVTGWLWTKFKQALGVLGIGTLVAGVGQLLGFWNIFGKKTPTTASGAPPPTP